MWRKAKVKKKLSGQITSPSPFKPAPTRPGLRERNSYTLSHRWWTNLNFLNSNIQFILKWIQNWSALSHHWWKDLNVLNSNIQSINFEMNSKLICPFSSLVEEIKLFNFKYLIILKWSQNWFTLSHRWWKNLNFLNSDN